jgi:hypothetical protein
LDVFYQILYVEGMMKIMEDARAEIESRIPYVHAHQIANR